MRYLLLIALLTSCLFSNAEKDGLWIGSTYKVLSSELDRNIPEGKAVLYGKVFKADNTPLESFAIIQNDSTIPGIKTDSGIFSQEIHAGYLTYVANLAIGEVAIPASAIQSQHRIEVEIHLRKQPKDRPMKKPVIYLYSDEPTDVELRIAPKGELTFTYPEYNDGWKISTLTNGGVKDQGSDKTYPYLFWEGESNELFYIMKGNAMEGFIVRTDTLVDFLEHTLSSMGLNDTEKTDFITFWAPSMQKSKYAFMQFLVDDEYSKNVASITIEPKPQSIRRVYILNSLLKDPAVGCEVIPQTFNTFDRDGFVVVEWGGSEIDLQSIQP